MNDYTDNRGFADWHARNHEKIPGGAMMRMSPPPDDVVGGTEVIWEFEDEEKMRDTFVSFIWDAQGAPVRGDYQVVDWTTDEILNTGAIRDTDTLIRVLRDAATNAA